MRGSFAIVVACALVAAPFPAVAPAAPPEARRLFPAGGPPGGTTTVVVSGTFPVWPVNVWSDRGQLAWECAPAPGVFRVTVPEQGAIGIHRVRFHDPSGATAVRRFLVDPLPALPEAEPNDSPASALDMAPPVVIDGVLEKAGDVDCVRVDLARGERLVATLDAHRTLASPFDAGLDLLDARGALIARNLDASGFDPRLVHVAQRDGPVVVRVFGLPATPDSTIGLAGGEGFVYRLALVTGPVFTGCVPGALGAGIPSDVVPRGLDLPSAEVALTGPDTGADPGRGAVWTATVPGAAGLVEVPVAGCAVVEAGPWPLATPLAALPVVVTGCLERAGEARGVRFSAAKGQALSIECAARSIGSAADPVVAIHDAAGRRLLVHDAPDERFPWKAPVDGDYQLSVSDRRDEASPWHAFRVSIAPDVPDVRLTVAADAVSGTVGKPIPVEVAIERRHGFATPLSIDCRQRPRGVEVRGAVSPAEGDAAKKVVLELICHEPCSGPLRVVAQPEGSTARTALVTASCGPEQVLELWVTAVPAQE